ncbi:MAG TPA: hypothetical protein V6D23_08855 [Candidatus Obscuribacterales bacterium]
MSSIVELIDAFHANKISSDDYLKGLDRHIQFAARKLAEVEKQQIVAEDRPLWDSELKPGLLAIYEGLIGAATEAKEFARTRDEELLKGVGILIAGIDQVMAILDQKSGGVSASTRQALEAATAGPGDDLSLENRPTKGSAESKVSFLD